MDLITDPQQFFGQLLTQIDGALAVGVFLLAIFTGFVSILGSTPNLMIATFTVLIVLNNLSSFLLGSSTNAIVVSFVTDVAVFACSAIGGAKFKDNILLGICLYVFAVVVAYRSMVSRCGGIEQCLGLP